MRKPAAKGSEHIPFVKPPRDTLNTAVGWVIFLFTLVVYALTRAATIPFWDCGEFIACSYTLGVPHPPGTPLYVLVGRIFSFIPAFLIEDYAARINWLSGVTSAGTAMLGYFVLARMITAWFSSEYTPQKLALFQRLAVYVGGIVGALFLAFSDTNWGNSVEAEVYGAAMFLMMSLLWLAMVWYERRADVRSDKYLIAIAYIGVLSIGIHMTSFLAMFAIFPLILLASPRLRKDPRFYVTGVVLALVVGGVETFLMLTTIWLLVSTVGHYWPMMRKGWAVLPLAFTLGGGLYALSVGESWPLYMGAFLGSLASFVVFRVIPQRRQWMLAHLILLAGLMGYTVQTYIPLRTMHDPALDMNNPESWQKFKGFLERKQYGQKSMIERALKRRGEWANQFGQHRRMGFWGFFDRQYGYWDQAFFPFFALGLFGIGSMIRFRWRVGLMLFGLILFASVGLVWYMNFADGTKYDPTRQDAYLEVRDRDYFFTPAFILFGMSMGLGCAGLITFMGSSLDKDNAPRGLRFFAAGLGCLLVLLPTKTLIRNWEPNDKSSDYIPWDYAYNILQTADQDAVLFTNGDNDTFPVWCLQQVYGIRQDVKVTNLSLINTHWYIKQLKNKLGVPISYTDEEIENLSHVLTPEGDVYRLQDRMVDNIIATNRWKLPINFSVTVPESNRKFRGQSITDHLLMIGMGYRLVPDTGTNMVDIETMHHKFWNVFQFRTINDPDFTKTESDRRLISNYASGFLFIANAKREEGDLRGAAEEVKRAMEIMPHQWQPYVFMAQLAGDMGDPTELRAVMEKALAADIPIPDLDQIAQTVYHSYERLGEKDLGKEMLHTALTAVPTLESSFKTLVRAYHAENNFDSILSLLQTWVKHNPHDSLSRRTLEEVKAQLSPVDVELEPPEDLPDSLQEMFEGTRRDTGR